MSARQPIAPDVHLPENLDAERMVLGAILNDASAFALVGSLLHPDDFSIEKHKRIFLRMEGLYAKGVGIDRVTLANELQGHGELQSVDGLSYLVQLDSLPHIQNLEHHAGIVREKAVLRRMIVLSKETERRASRGDEASAEVLGSAVESLMRLGDSRDRNALVSAQTILDGHEGGAQAFLDPRSRTRGLETGFQRFDEMTGGLREGELMILAARPAMGKAQPIDSVVKTPTGWKAIGELAVGEAMASLDGDTSVVTGIFPQGRKPVYRISFSDGRSTLCCGEHLWTVQYRTWEGGSRNITTFEIAQRLNRKRYQGRLSIPRMSGDFGSKRQYCIKPWLLGYILGNGCFSKVSISIPDPETVKRVRKELLTYKCELSLSSKKYPGIDYRVRAVCGRSDRSIMRSGYTKLSEHSKSEVCRAYSGGSSGIELSRLAKVSPGSIYGLLKRRGIVRRTGGTPQNGLQKILASLGMAKQGAQEKAIPEECFEMDREFRRELLRGLLDSDGTAGKDGSIQFCSTSRRLAMDVQRLVWSLGGISRISPKNPKFTYRGETRDGLPAWTVSVIVDSPEDVFWLKRKRQRVFRKTGRCPRLNIESVVPVGEQDCVCIRVSHPSQTYITNDYLVTHNSAWAMQVASHIAMKTIEPKAVALFSLEMSKESLLHRLMCSQARVDLQKYRAGYISPDEHTKLGEALYDIHQAPIYLDDTPGINLLDVHAKLRRLQASADLGLVIIDYLQLMQGRGSYENRQQEVSSLSRGFKLMARELKVPFMVLSQLSRAPETRSGDHRPILSDLRESGAIEQDADLVAFIFREEVYRPDKESLRGIAELILGKQRNGPTGRIKLAFLRQFTRFENYSLEAEPSEGYYSGAA